MRVMAPMSAGTAARMAISLMGGGGNGYPKTTAPRRSGRGAYPCGSDHSAAITEQLEQHREHVDEIQIERQRAHDGLAARDGAVVVHIVHFLDPLRVPGGEPGEHEDAHDRDHELQRGTREE